MYIHVAFATCLVALLVGRGEGFTSGNETQLRTALFVNSSYDVSVRPEEATTISLGLVPTSLIGIDIKAQTMSISGWWNLSWTDSRLSWDPQLYANINETHVFEDEVWSPSIVVYNSVNDLSAIDADTIPVRIQSSGRLEWSPPIILTVSCATDITFFPFDVQTCGVEVQSFGYTVRQVVLSSSDQALDLTYFTENGEWSLIDQWADASSDQARVRFSFRFERKPGFYGMNVILPVVMLAVLSFFIFALPPESGEKMGFSLTVLLTFVVFMTLLSDKMPSTADHTSYLEVYVVLVLTFCALSVVLSIVNLQLHFRPQTQEVPRWARRLTRLLHRLVCSETFNTVGISSQTSVAKAVVVLAPSREGDEDNRVGSTPSSPDRHVRDEQEVTWRVVSKVMDSFLLRFYVVVLFLLTVIFLGVIGWNS